MKSSKAILNVDEFPMKPQITFLSKLTQIVERVSDVFEKNFLISGCSAAVLYSCCQTIVDFFTNEKLWKNVF